MTLQCMRRGNIAELGKVRDDMGGLQPDKVTYPTLREAQRIWPEVLSTWGRNVMGESRDDAEKDGRIMVQERKEQGQEKEEI